MAARRSNQKGENRGEGMPSQATHAPSKEHREFVAEGEEVRPTGGGR